MHSFQLPDTMTNADALKACSEVLLDVMSLQTVAGMAADTDESDAYYGAITHVLTIATQMLTAVHEEISGLERDLQKDAPKPAAPPQPSTTADLVDELRRIVASDRTDPGAQKLRAKLADLVTDLNARDSTKGSKKRATVPA